MVHLGVGLCAGTDVPLGIIAAGTGNDVARELGLPVHDAAAAARLIDTGRVRSIDAGRAEDDHGVVRWWVGVLGAGFDARVNERANGWSWPTGRWRYVLAVARELPVFRPIPYVVEVDGQRRETGAMLVAVANGPSYGGGMRVCPDAVLDDGLLDVLVLPGSRSRRSCGCSPGVRRHRTCGTRRCRCCGDDGSGWRRRASSPTPTASGSARCRSTCEVVPGALRVLVPRADVA